MPTLPTSSPALFPFPFRPPVPSLMHKRTGTLACTHTYTCARASDIEKTCYMSPERTKTWPRHVQERMNERDRYINLRESYQRTTQHRQHKDSFHHVNPRRRVGCGEIAPARGRKPRSNEKGVVGSTPLEVVAAAAPGQGDKLRSPARRGGGAGFQGPGDAVLFWGDRCAANDVIWLCNL